MLGGRQQGFDKPRTLHAAQQRCAKPERFKTVDEVSGFAQIGGPEYVLRRCARTTIGEDRLRSALLDVGDIPAARCRTGADRWRTGEGEFPLGLRDEANEGLPQFVGLLPVKAQERQLDVKRMARLDVDDLAPVTVVQAVGVEIHECAHEAAE